MFTFYKPTNEFSIGIFHGTYYGLCLAIGILAGLFLTSWLARKRNLKSDDIYVVALFVLPLAILGARIYYCIFSGQSYTLLEFFSIWNGGLAVYGAIIGGALGGLLYSLIFNKNYFLLFDVAVPGLLLGQAIGRIGCYFGGCCYGEVITDPNLQFFPLGVQISHIWHYSTFFMESLWTLIGFIVAISLFKKMKSIGMLTSFYMIWYGLGRSIIEQFRGDSLTIANTGIRVSQLISITILLIGLVSLIVNIIDTRSEKKDKNGKEV